MTQPNALPAPSATGDLEFLLAAVESSLGALGEALRQRDVQAIDAHAAELHRALALAVDRFVQAARTGRVPPSLRQRLAAAGGQVAAQRESLARATAALDRAIDVLLPHSVAPAICDAGGLPERTHPGGVAQT
jgi:hypothetical protein